MWHRHLGGLIALLMLMKFCGFLPPNGVAYIGSDTNGYKEGFRTPMSSSALFCVVILLYQWYKEAFRVKKDGVLCECDPVLLLSTALCPSGTQFRSCCTIFSFIALSPKQAAPQLCCTEEQEQRSVSAPRGRVAGVIRWKTRLSRWARTARTAWKARPLTGAVHSNLHQCRSETNPRIVTI